MCEFPWLVRKVCKIPCVIFTDGVKYGIEKVHLHSPSFGLAAVAERIALLAAIFVCEVSCWTRNCLRFTGSL